MNNRSWNVTGLPINMRHSLWVVHQFLPYKLQENEYSLTKITIQRKDDGWLMVLTREKRGTSEVAFVSAPHYNTTYGLAALAILHRKLVWRASKF